ncbi:MAG: hypothetical protein LKM30_05275 [Bacilli bacterium]|jgi:hypothetical protein|nr:hypothetical protein [Bacilli bacterium]
MKSRSKYHVLVFLSFVLVPSTFVGISALFVALNVDKIWGNMFVEGMGNLNQFFTLLAYRLLIYFLPPILLSFIPFDKRYSWFNRLLIWMNWCFLVLIIANLIIKFFGIDLILLKDNISILSIVDTAVSLSGYVLTFIKKKKVTFDSTDSVLGEKPY